jgi:deazaflavin-dependent oxidoreductase (nitroreductase family)
MAMATNSSRDHAEGRSLSARVPFFVSLFNPVARRLLGSGIPLGPNALLTVLGRKSGTPRTTPVALVEVDGRRWIISTFGDVNWSRNLRAAGRATLTVKRRPELVDATELSPEERVRFFRDVLGPYVRRVPLGRFLLGTILGARDILANPEAAAQSHPVFELRRAAP